MQPGLPSIPHQTERRPEDRVGGNTSKLAAAKSLIRAILPVFTAENDCLLIDSWYMRGTLILYALKNGIHVIGQVRKDTALYDIPCFWGHLEFDELARLSPWIKLLHSKTLIYNALNFPNFTMVNRTRTVQDISPDPQNISWPENL